MFFKIEFTVSKYDHLSLYIKRFCLILLDSSHIVVLSTSMDTPDDSKDTTEILVANATVEQLTKELISRSHLMSPGKGKELGIDMLDQLVERSTCENTNLGRVKGTTQTPSRHILKIDITDRFMKMCSDDIRALLVDATIEYHQGEYLVHSYIIVELNNGVYFQFHEKYVRVFTKETGFFDKYSNEPVEVKLQYFDHYVPSEVVQLLNDENCWLIHHIVQRINTRAVRYNEYPIARTRNVALCVIWCWDQANADDSDVDGCNVDTNSISGMLTLPKEVAVLIAKKVWDSREERDTWWPLGYKSVNSYEEDEDDMAYPGLADESDSSLELFG